MRLSYDLKMEIDTKSPELFLRQLGIALEGRSWPSVVGSSTAPDQYDDIPKPRKRKTQPMDVFVQHAMTLCNDPTMTRLWLADASRERKPEEGFHGDSMAQWRLPSYEKSCSFSMSLFPDESLFSDPAENVRALVHVARGLFRQGAVLSAVVLRRENPNRHSPHPEPLRPIIPNVPIAEFWNPLVLTDEEEVAKNYECPEDFYQAGWTVESLGKKRLLSRSEDVVTRGELLRKYGDMQWQMARAANPGSVKLYDSEVLPEELDSYEAGERRLKLVHFDKFAGALEYTCSLEPGEHLQGREFFDLNRIVNGQFLPDWTKTTGPVSVCVEFAEAWMAESEKRPFLGLGAKVCSIDPATGERVWIEK